MKMKKSLKGFATMAVFAIVALLSSACSSNEANGDDVYQYFWKAQYLEYNISENNLGITPDKLEKDVTDAMSPFTSSLNEEGTKTNVAALQKAVVACKAKWQEKGWYSYIKRIKFNIGIFDTFQQHLTPQFTWEIGTDVDEEG